MRAHSLLLLTLVASLSAAGPDWPHYGGGPDQTRYSPLTQITPANVGSLKVAWTYDTGDAFKGSEMQCQPVVAHGVLYATSPKLRVFALDAATGALKWSFDPNEDAKNPTRTRIRGLMYWERGDERRIYFGARHWLYALDATTGKPIAELRPERPDRPARGLRGPRSAHAQRRRQHAGRLLRRSADPRLDRARRAAVGARRHPRVRRPHRASRTGRSTRSRIRASSATTPGRRTRGSTAAAPTRGRACRSTRSAGSSSRRPARPSYDFYGANRLGDNLFANTILCLRAATGERVWHFQAVKHDVWDRDFPAPPALITITKRRPAARRRRADRQERAHCTSSIAKPASRSFRWRRSRRRRPTCRANSSSPRSCCRRCRRPSRASSSPRT